MVGVWRYSWSAVKMFLPLISVVMCKHLSCNALWLTILCSHVLFDCAYDMEHVSEIIYYHYYIIITRVNKRIDAAFTRIRVVLNHFQTWLRSQQHDFYRIFFLSENLGWTLRPNLNSGIRKLHCQECNEAFPKCCGDILSLLLRVWKRRTVG